jgi:hypothetical protein
MTSYNKAFHYLLQNPIATSSGKSSLRNFVKFVVMEGSALFGVPSLGKHILSTMAWG